MSGAATDDIQPIRPFTEHPGYWQYDGQTLLLIGGSREDNLFQIDDLEPHLDTLAEAGGNYIRNTMSDRDPGDARAFARIEEGPDAGRYDLDRWNPEYWDRFDRLLRLCFERQVIVQIEVWDRFDHSREPWLSDPWNPANNITYTQEQTGLEPEYPKHPSQNLQPFFHTVPSMDDNELLRDYQERFVDKLLSISLRYPNVLYCMNNETHEDPAWGQYWLSFIRKQAAAVGLEVQATDMFDGPWQEGVPPVAIAQFADPAMYPFIDVSQINAWRCTTERHWANLEQLHGLNADPLRPLNNTKVYGADTLKGRASHQGPRMSDRDGITSWWLNLLGGCASARFHRPTSGLGLSEKAQASIRAARQVEQVVRFWDLEPRFDWTGGRPRGEAFLAQQADRISVVLLPVGGSVTPAPPIATGAHELRWMNLLRGEWAASATVELKPDTPLAAPDDGCWLAVLQRPG